MDTRAIMEIIGRINSKETSFEEGSLELIMLGMSSQDIIALVEGGMIKR